MLKGGKKKYKLLYTSIFSIQNVQRGSQEQNQHNHQKLQETNNTEDQEAKEEDMAALPHQRDLYLHSKVSY